MQLSHVTAFWLRLAGNIPLDLFLYVHMFCPPLRARDYTTFNVAWGLFRKSQRLEMCLTLELSSATLTTLIRNANEAVPARICGEPKWSVLDRFVQEKM